MRGRTLIWSIFVIFLSYPGSMRFILARATNPGELSFDLRIYPSVAAFCCCCGGAVAARRARLAHAAAVVVKENEERTRFW